MVDSLEESQETIKKNTVVVESSLTKESSLDKDNIEFNMEKQGEGIHAFGGVEKSDYLRTDNINSTRYFIIKSLSHHNIQLSVQKGIWATQVMNEPVLETAFHNSDRVILIFSVNMSGYFQGYAQMMSSVGWRRDNVWSRTGGNNPWGRSFEVKWLQLQDLPFQKTLHLKNPLNDYKPVKISRDCQELPEDVGEALCSLFDEEVELLGKSKRTSYTLDDALAKGHSPFQDDDGLLSLPSSNLRWPGATMLNQSLPYQYVAEHDGYNFHSVQEGLSIGSFLHNSPSSMEAQNMMLVKQSHVNGSLSNREGDRASFRQQTKRDSSREGNLAVSISEEDILNMTYEEYLQAVMRSYTYTPSSQQVEKQGPTNESPISREQDGDRYSRYHSKEAKSRSRSFH